jgi:hypothetical protein
MGELSYPPGARLANAPLWIGRMQPLGYSTGALAMSDFRIALEMLKHQPVQAVELSAIREHELIPLLQSLADLDLSQFSYVSIHAPSSYSPEAESSIFQELYSTRHRGWPIIVHPDTLRDSSLWKQLGNQLCIENMDKRKPVGRTVRELELLFEEFPEASFCFDIGHARQVDTSMTEAYLMLKRFGSRLRQVHISEVNTRNKHDRLSFVSILGFQEVTHLIPSSVPVIIESIIPEDQIGAEICRVKRALHAPAEKVEAS